MQDAIAQGTAQLAGRSLGTKADPLVRRTPSKTVSSRLPLTMTSSLPRSGYRQVPEVGRCRPCSVAGKASITQPRIRRDIASLAVGPRTAPSSNTSTCSSNFGDRNEDLGAALKLATVAPPRGAQGRGCDDIGTGPADKPQRVARAGSAGGEPPEARDAPAPVQPPAQEVQETFEPKKWLCDASISFAFGCLASSGNSVLGGISRRLPAALSLMDPATAFWLAKQQNPEDVEEARSAMKLHELDLVVCPINDSRDLDQADAGLHWTLLVCWRAAGSRADGWGSRTPSKAAGGPFHHYRYYDSLGCGLASDPGFQTAQELANRLAGRPVDVFVGSCSRQTNFYDCGTYLLLFAEVVVTTFLGVRSGEIPGAGSAPVWEERLAAVTPEESDACRAHYHALAQGATTP